MVVGRGGACRQEVILFAAAGTPLPSKDLVFVCGLGGVSFGVRGVHVGRQSARGEYRHRVRIGFPSLVGMYGSRLPQRVAFLGVGRGAAGCGFSLSLAFVGRRK